jgi:hypothetical protein
MVRITGTLGEQDLTPQAREELLAVFRNWKNRCARGAVPPS